MQETKTCPKCEREKNVIDFPLRHDRAGLRSICKECYRAYNRERYRLKRERGWTRPPQNQTKYRYPKSPKSRKKDVLAKHGMTLQSFETLKELQGNRCAICEVLEGGPRGFYIDHDHTTNKVRGLLCQHCNSGIGFLKDNISILRSAIKYLENSPAKELDHNE